MENTTITSPEQIKSVLWLVKALGSSPSRPILHGIHVEGNKAVATDGRRMHIWTMEAFQTIPEGDWAVVSSSAKAVTLKKLDVHYPNWKAVVPRDQGNTLTAGGMKGICGWAQCGVILLETATLIDLQNVIDAVGFGTLWAKKKQALEVKVTWDDITRGDSIGKNPVCVFPEHDKQAILMPLQGLVERNFG